jgi:hypothetical protein
LNNLTHILEGSFFSGMFGNIKAEALQHPATVDTLYELALADNERVAWRAAWVLLLLQQENAELINPKLADIAEKIPQLKFGGVVRSFLSILSKSQFTDYSVEFINFCFDNMLSPKQKPAIQVYCMYILLRVCDIYPDFRPELQACLEHTETNLYSKSFNAARRKVLKELFSKNKNPSF